MEEQLKKGERLKIFLWHIFVRPIINTLNSARALANWSLFLLFISMILLLLKKIIPSIPDSLANVYFPFVFFGIYFMFSLISIWQSGEDIGAWRKFKKIPNSTQIKNIKEQGG